MVELAIPRPPYLAGSAKKARCMVVGGVPPVIAKIKTCLMDPPMAEICHQYRELYKPNKATDWRVHELKLHKLHVVAIMLYLLILGAAYSNTELIPA